MTDAQNRFGGTDPAPPALNAVATVLLAAITATGGALTVFGANSDRVWLMLDESDSRVWLIVAAVAAVVAVGTALVSDFLSVGLKAAVLVVGVLAYLGALLAAVWAATVAADAAGRPSIVDVTVDATGTGRTVSLEVQGASVDENERIGVAIRDVGADPDVFLLKSYPGATAGKVTLKAKFPIPAGVQKMEAMVWTFKEGDHDKPRCSKEEAGDKTPRADAEVVLVDCLHVVIPEGAAPTPPPTPTSMASPAP